MTDSLDSEARRLSGLLRGKTVVAVARHRSNELLLQFEDGTRLLVNAAAGELDFSVTSGSERNSN